MEDLEFSKAPRENIETWDLTKKLITVGSIVVILILAVMAITLTG